MHAYLVVAFGDGPTANVKSRISVSMGLRYDTAVIGSQYLGQTVKRIGRQ
jgi:hypothetical protein